VRPDRVVGAGPQPPRWVAAFAARRILAAAASGEVADLRDWGACYNAAKAALAPAPEPEAPEYCDGTEIVTIVRVPADDEADDLDA
jgi:hypothetical protein